MTLYGPITTRSLQSNQDLIDHQLSIDVGVLMHSYVGVYNVCICVYVCACVWRGRANH